MSRGGPLPASLAAAAGNVRVVVASVGAAHRAELAREGITEGAVVCVVARAPLGGPLVVRVGRARVALDGAVARSIVVAPVAGEAG